MPLPTLKQVKSIALAVLSGRDKKLQAERDAICATCPALVKHVTRSRWTHKLQIDSHCSKCGCGTRPMSGLRRNKNAYRKLSCPDKLWPGDEQDRGGLSIHQMSQLINVYERTEVQLATMQMHIDDGKPLTDQQFNELSGRELQQLRMAQGRNGVPAGIPGGQPNPKAAAAAAAAKARPGSAKESRLLRDRHAAAARPVADSATQAKGQQGAMAAKQPARATTSLDRLLGPQEAEARPHISGVTDQPSKDQIPDRLVKQHFRKAGEKRQAQVGQ